MVLKFLDDVSQSFFDPSETFLYWFIEEKIVVSRDFVVLSGSLKFLVICHCSYFLF